MAQLMRRILDCRQSIFAIFQVLSPQDLAIDSVWRVVTERWWLAFSPHIAARKRRPSAQTCTLLIRETFPENPHRNVALPTTTLKDLASAIVDCIKAGAHIGNLGAAPVAPSASIATEVTANLDYGASRGVLVIAAAGN